MPSLQTNRLAVITGGTKGFGKDIAKKLFKSYDLALIYNKDIKNADSTLAELQSLIPDGHIVKAYPCDVSNRQEVHSLYNKIKKDFKSETAVLVNCAGVAMKELFILENMDNHIRSMEINYFGALNMCKVLLPDMVRAKFGRIINISSNNVTINNRGSGAYCASKAALEKFTQILGGEMSKNGITVNAIRPGLSDTEMSHDYVSSLSKENLKVLLSPSEEFIDGDEIAKAVVFLIDSRQVNSSILTVDSGHALFRRV